MGLGSNTSALAPRENTQQLRLGASCRKRISLMIAWQPSCVWSPVSPRWVWWSYMA